MKPYGPFPLVAGVQQEIDLDLAPVVGTLVLKNLSPFTLAVQAYQGLAKIIPLTLDALPIRDFQGKLLVTPAADLTFQNSPGHLLYIDAYGEHEQVPGTYPVSLGWLTNIGNAVPVMSSVSALQNNGNAAGTPIIDAQDSASALENFRATNSGELLLRTVSRATQIQAVWVQPGDAVNPTRVYIVGGGNNGGGAELHLQSDHNGVLTDVIQTVPGFAPTAPANLLIGYATGVIVRFGNIQRISGTGPGTFNHTLGLTPNVVLIQPRTGSATAWAANNETSTTVDIHIANGIPWVGIVANIQN